MITFVLACAGLILLSGLFYLLPKKRPEGTDEALQRANLDWFRLRQQELQQEGDSDLQADARLRLFEDEQSPTGQPPPAPSSASFPAWILLPVVILLSCGLYYRLGAAADVIISRQLHSLDETTTAPTMDALMSAIETRSAQRPGNLDYQALLGRYFMGREDYQRAASTYAGLAREVPEDAQVLAYAAQADYLAAGRQLSEQARLRAEQALAIDPHQRTALGLLGMASFEQERYRAAVEYWQRLQATEAPDSDAARMIAGVIATARQRLGEEGAAQVTAASAASTAGVTVRVTLPEGAGLAATDTVFVLARNAESGSRMPIAVQRLQAGQLPVTLRLDDTNSMAGQRLSGTASIMVIVQVSPDGRPGEAAASWLGEAGPLAPSVATEPLEIQLRPNNS